MEPKAPQKSVRATVLLGAALSAALVVAWLAFVLFAPAPLPPSEPKPELGRESTRGVTIRLLMPRGAIPRALLDRFAEHKGSPVVAEEFANDTEALARLAANPVAYDAALLSGASVARLVDNYLAVLSPVAVAGAGVLDPDLVAIGTAYDPANRHALVLNWSVLGIAYDSAKIAARLGQAAEMPSWSWFLDPALAAKLADCGIAVRDDAADAFAAALATMGRPLETKQVADYEAAAKRWENVRDKVLAFTDDDLPERFAAGQVCVALTRSDVAYRARVAVGPKNAPAFAIPREGAVARHEFLVVPVQARYAKEAEALFAFLLRPDVAARIVTARGVAPAVRLAAPLLGAEVRAAVYPDPGAAPVVGEADLGAEIAGLRERFWRLIAAPALSPP